MEISDEAKALHRIRNLTEPGKLNEDDPVGTVVEVNEIAWDAWRAYLRKLEGIDD